MGLFSSSYKTYVGTSVTRVIEDKIIPQSSKSGMIRSLFNDGNVSDYITEEYFSSIGLKAESMYNYAEQHYTHGLPTGEIYSSTQGRQQVEAVIEAAEGQQVLIEYSHYGPANAMHVAWMKLVSQYGYSQATNQIGALTAQKGVPVYLKDMQVIIPASQQSTLNNGVLQQWGTAPSAGYSLDRPASGMLMLSLTQATLPVVSSSATELQVMVSYAWQLNATAAIQESSFVITLSEYSGTDEYFHAKYLVGTTAKYWMYRNKSGTYPTLDNVFVDGPAESGSYFPFAYFRYNKQSVGDDKTSAEYLTTKKMVKYLGMDFDSVVTAINTNPDVADVEQAMLVMGVPSVSTDRMENQYLFEYFDTLFYAMDGGTSESLTILQAGVNEPLASKTIIIKDQKFKMGLTNSGIYKRLVPGTIGDVGQHTSIYEQVQEQQTSSGEYGDYTVASTVGWHRYRFQIAPGLYEEVSVRSLKMTYYVLGDYTTTADETDNILLIPIDHSITEHYSLPDREQLYARSLHMVFNSVVVQKVKWYQTGLFQVVMLVIAVVLTIADYGADGGSWIASALELSGTEGLIATIIFNVVVMQYVTPLGFKLLVKVVGQKAAEAIAIILIITGVLKVSEGGMGALPAAVKLLQFSSGLIGAVYSSKITDLVNEESEFKKQIDEQTKILETTQEMLDKQHLLEPFMIFGEKPEDFYNRTVHFGNIGTLGITAVSSYVDIALTLPKINDTLGETFNDLSS